MITQTALTMMMVMRMCCRCNIVEVKVEPDKESQDDNKAILAVIGLMFVTQFINI